MIYHSMISLDRATAVTTLTLLLPPHPPCMKITTFEYPADLAANKPMWMHAAQFSNGNVDSRSRGESVLVVDLLVGG